MARFSRALHKKKIKRGHAKHFSTQRVRAGRKWQCDSSESHDFRSRPNRGTTSAVAIHLPPNDLVRGEKFDPAQSQEVFRVAMSDHALMIVLPSLLASVRTTATHVKLEVSASGIRLMS